MRKLTPEERQEQKALINQLYEKHYMKHTPDISSTPGEPVAFVKTSAGEQGVIIQTQRTQKNIKAKFSGIPLSEQIKGTMFETPAIPEPSLFGGPQ